MSIGLLGGKGLESNEIDEIRESLEKESDPLDLMDRTSRLLSIHSDCIGIVLSPRISTVVMKHIEFVRLTGSRVLVILVSKGGLVQHKSIKLGRDVISDRSRSGLAGTFVENFAGKTLSEIRDRAHSANV